MVEQDNYLLVDGLHEAIIPEETWQAAQVKLAAQAKKYEHVNKAIAFQTNRNPHNDHAQCQIAQD